MTELNPVTFSISKYWGDIPFGHRQPKHEGHCHDLHGHNWGFTFTFTCKERDDKGFVIDFGGLKKFKAWIDENFDHKMVFNEDDEEMKILEEQSPFLKVKWVPDCSAEGLAEYMLYAMNSFLWENFYSDVENRGLKVSEVIVHEDSKNTATCRYT